MEFMRMPDLNETVTVANRSSKPLLATWDGRPYDIPPYPEQVRLSRIVALAARFQNPIMGRGTPAEDWNSKSEYLVGIVEDNDPITPTEQTDEPQRWDSYLVNGPNTEVIRARGGYSEVRQSQPKAEDGGFVKP